MKKVIAGVVIACFTIGLTAFTAPVKETAAKSNMQNTDKGKSIYAKTCIACHQANGQGVPGAFPPLANSDYLNKDANRAIRTVLNGLSGEITVNGKKYNAMMTSQGLTDEQVADVLTYVYGNWGNSGKKVSPEMVKAQRGKK